VAGIPGRLLDRGRATEHDQVGERHLFVASLRGVEPGLDAFERLEHLRQLFRLVDGPVLLRRQANARAVGAATLVGAAVGRGRGPRRGDEFRDGQARRQQLRLERGPMSRCVSLNQARANASAN
jgi:hypothetical protein